METLELVILSSLISLGDASQAVEEASAHQDLTLHLGQPQLDQEEDHHLHLDHHLLCVHHLQLAKNPQLNSDTALHHAVDQCSA